jgi:hypothetical protein
MFAILFIVVIALAGLGLAWSTPSPTSVTPRATSSATARRGDLLHPLLDPHRAGDGRLHVPDRAHRPPRLREATIVGVVLLVAAVLLGKYVTASTSARSR